MTTKRFIDTTGMQEEILELLKQEYLTKTFYGEKIELKLDLKDIVAKKMEEQGIEEPLIYITVNAYQKVLTLVKEFDSEVAWHCTVEHLPNTNAYLITDCLIFPQEVTGATANGIDGEYEMWLATLPDEQFELVRCHMHSHVNMGTTPSGVDENYQKNLMTHVTDYYIFMIVNKKSDYTLRFYDKQNNIVYDDLDLIVCFEDGTPLQTWFDSVKDVVKEKKAEPILTKRKTYTGYEESYDYDYAWRQDHFNFDYYGYDKKKETSTKRGRGRPKKSTSTQVKIQCPDNSIRTFISIDYAVNFIYNQYPKKNHAFSKNNMRKFLAKQGVLAFDPETNDFMYDKLNEQGALEYAILKGDVWEVLKK